MSKWRKDPYTVSPHSRPDLSVISHTHPAIPCAISSCCAPRTGFLLVLVILPVPFRPSDERLKIESGEIPRTFDSMQHTAHKGVEGTRGVLGHGANATIPTIPRPPSRPLLPHDLSGRTLERCEASLSARRGERKWQLHDANTTNRKPTAIPPVNAQPPPYEPASSWPRPGRSDIKRAGKTDRFGYGEGVFRTGVYIQNETDKHTRHIHRAEYSHAIRFSRCTDPF